MRLALRLAAASLLLVFAACDSSTPPTTGETDGDPKAPLGQLPDSVRPLRYRIELVIDPSKPSYSGVASIYAEVKGLQRVVYLHGQELKVAEVTAQPSRGAPIKGKYEEVHASGVARLSFEEDLPPGRLTFRIPFTTKFPAEPDALTSMPDSGHKYAWTQFEAISARRAFPSFDEPRFKTPYDIVVTARKNDRVITNTLPLKEEDVADGMKKVTFESTEPLPTYLIAFAVGPYDVTEGKPIPGTKQRVDVVPLRGVTVAGKGERVRYALDQTPPLVRYLEDYFATPFPYPKLDLIAPPNFTAGGMENAGAITYTERGILLDDASSVQQKRYFTSLHAHEVAHQWFGDLVTPKWWDDIWLNEAFASWMADKSAAVVWPQGEFSRETVRDALEVMDEDSLASARAVRQPIKSNDDIVNAFDGLTYNKGAGVLAMFESYLGPDVFREGVRKHMQRFAHGVADVNDFMESLAQGAGKPEIVAAFKTFLDQPGVPLIHVETTCQGRDLQVTLAQSPFGAQNVNDKRRWSVPVCMRDVKGKPQPCTLLTEPNATQLIKNACGAVMLPNTGGAGYYRFSMRREDWQKLAAALPRLTTAEQIAALHSLRAAFRAGDADAATYLGALQAVGSTAVWDAVEVTRNFLAEMRGNLVAQADIPLLEQKVRAWFTPAMKRAGVEPRPREAPAVALARVELADLLVKVGREPGAIAALSAKGADYLRAVSQGQTDATLAREMIPIALWAAVFSGGEQVARDATAAIKASSEAEFRYAAIRALAAARDPKAITVVQDFILSGALKVRELRTYLREAFADAEARPQAWAWLRKDFKRITAPTPKESHSRFIDLPSKLCTDGARAEIEWFFKPMVDELIGAPRTFANTLETVDRCVSWRKARGPEVAAALRAQ